MTDKVVLQNYIFSGLVKNLAGRGMGPALLIISTRDTYHVS